MYLIREIDLYKVHTVRLLIDSVPLGQRTKHPDPTEQVSLLLQEPRSSELKIFYYSEEMKVKHKPQRNRSTHAQKQRNELATSTQTAPSKKPYEKRNSKESLCRIHDSSKPKENDNTFLVNQRRLTKRSEESIYNRSPNMDANRNRAMKRRKRYSDAANSSLRESRNDYSEEDRSPPSKKHRINSNQQSGRSDDSVHPVPNRENAEWQKYIRNKRAQYSTILSDENEEYSCESEFDEGQKVSGRKFDSDALEKGSRNAHSPAEVKKNVEVDEEGIDERGTDIVQHRPDSDNLSQPNEKSLTPTSPRSRRIESRDSTYMVEEEEWASEAYANEFFAEDGELEDTNDPLVQLLRSQAEKEKLERQECGERDSENSHGVHFRTSNESTTVSVRDLWESEVLRRNKDFYYGSEAKLVKPLRVSQTRSGGTKAQAYRGVSVNEHNNLDIRHAGEKVYANTARNGAGTESWAQFRICMGQFVRPCVAYERVDLDNAWRSGEFYKVATEKHIFQAFLQYFRGKARCASIMNKSKLLARFVKGALMYFTQKPLYAEDSANRSMISKMEETLLYLNQMASENKKKSRVERARAKEETNRVEGGKFVPEEDFDDFRELAFKRCAGIMESVGSEVAKSSNADIATKISVFRGLIIARPGLLDKWGLNFIALLVFFGNGQRNQVYRMLRAPILPDLLVFERENERENENVPLKLDLVESSTEKVPRDVRIPYIMFDNVILPCLRFHVEVVLPVLHQKAVENNAIVTQHLLLHTKKGTKLSSMSVRYAVTSFVHGINPELHLTPKDIRASFSTYMIRKYVQAIDKKDPTDSFHALPVNVFKEMMAAVMNTSVEMLEQVYMEATYGSYGNHIAQVLKLGGFSKKIDYCS